MEVIKDHPMLELLLRVTTNSKDMWVFGIPVFMNRTIIFYDDIYLVAFEDEYPYSNNTGTSILCFKII